MFCAEDHRTDFSLADIPRVEVGLSIRSTAAFIVPAFRAEGEHTASPGKSTKPTPEGNAMRMILLHVDEATPVYVNPQLVRTIIPYSESRSRIYFDEQHFVVVQEAAEAVAHAIENVR
jgi:hypothetical protein